MKKESVILCTLIIYGLFTFHCNGIIFSSKLQIADTINIPSDYLSSKRENKASYHKPETIFKTSDSIYSLSSTERYFPTLLHNIGEQATAPFHFNRKDWIITGSAVGITAALMSADNGIDNWARVQKQKHAWVAKSSPVITQLGGSYGIFSVAAMGILSAASDNKKGVQTSLLATQAMITSGLWVRLLKLVAGRERPMADYIYSKSDGGKWYGPLKQFDQDTSPIKSVTSFDSFPSGHTATAFSIATVFASQFKDIKAVPIICYSGATLVGISRLTEHEHWASDVFAGGLIGYLCGKQVVGYYNKTHLNPTDPSSSTLRNKTELTFIQSGNQIGFQLQW